MHRGVYGGCARLGDIGAFGIRCTCPATASRFAGLYTGAYFAIAARRKIRGITVGWDVAFPQEAAVQSQGIRKDVVSDVEFRIYEGMIMLVRYSCEGCRTVASLLGLTVHGNRTHAEMVRTLGAGSLSMHTVRRQAQAQTATAPQQASCNAPTASVGILPKLQT